MEAWEYFLADLQRDKWAVVEKFKGCELGAYIWQPPHYIHVETAFCSNSYEYHYFFYYEGKQHWADSADELERVLTQCGFKKKKSEQLTLF